MRQLRELFTLHFEQHLQQRQIARSLGVARSTIERTLKRFTAAGSAIATNRPTHAGPQLRCNRDIGARNYKLHLHPTRRRAYRTELTGRLFARLLPVRELAAMNAAYFMNKK